MKRFLLSLFLFLAFFSVPKNTSAQQAHIVVEPTALTLNVGDEVQLTANAISANNEVMPDTVLFFYKAGEIDEQLVLHAMDLSLHINPVLIA